MKSLRILASIILCAATLVVDVQSTSAQQIEKNTQGVDTLPSSKDAPPYETRLHRIAELAGSLHYLTSLCNLDQHDGFRLKMQQIIDAETATEPLRRKQLIAKYNQGYRAFSSVYTSCTTAAQTAQQNYRREGQNLIGELLARYAN